MSLTKIETMISHNGEDWQTAKITNDEAVKNEANFFNIRQP